MDASAESALVVLAPDAEALVKPFRDRYDPVAAHGMPAHFTILYPFLPPPELTAGVLEALDTLFSRFSPFTVSLARLDRFPGVLYLAPAPDSPLARLTHAAAAQFPQTPPYRGAYAGTIPHLTVAQLSDEQRLDAVAADLDRNARGHLPLQVTVAAVTLMERRAGRWYARTAFKLGRA